MKILWGGLWGFFSVLCVLCFFLWWWPVPQKTRRPEDQGLCLQPALLIAVFVMCFLSQTKLCLCHVFCNLLFCFMEDLVNPVTWVSFFCNKKTKERKNGRAYDMVCAWRRSPWLVRDTTWLIVSYIVTYQSRGELLRLYKRSIAVWARMSHHRASSSSWPEQLTMKMVPIWTSSYLV